MKAATGERLFRVLGWVGTGVVRAEEVEVSDEVVQAIAEERWGGCAGAGHQVGPALPGRHYSPVAVAAKKNDWAAVARLAQQVPNLPDGWLVATFLRMKVCYRQGQLVEGSRQRDALQRVVDRDQGRFGTVVQWAEKLRERLPASPAAWFLLGCARHSAGECDRAIADYDKAIALRPDLALAYFNKGLACKKAGRREEAIAAFRRFIELAEKAGMADYLPDARQQLRELGAK